MGENVGDVFGIFLNRIAVGIFRLNAERDLIGNVRRDGGLGAAAMYALDDGHSIAWRLHGNHVEFIADR